jgi:hypothetical protein
VALAGWNRAKRCQRKLLQSERTVERHGHLRGPRPLWLRQRLAQHRRPGHELSAIDARPGIHPGPKLFLDHPDTPSRVIHINALAGSDPTRPLLNPAEWAALKRICAGKPE